MQNLLTCRPTTPLLSDTQNLSDNVTSNAACKACWLQLKWKTKTRVISIESKGVGTITIEKDAAGPTLE
jgi:hypothetical protein